MLGAVMEYVCKFFHAIHQIQVKGLIEVICVLKQNQQQKYLL